MSEFKEVSYELEADIEKRKKSSSGKYFLLNNQSINQSNSAVSISLSDSENEKDYKNQIKELDSYVIYSTLKIFLYLIPSILATIIYLYTLKGCYMTQFECLNKYPIRFVQYVIYAIIFCAFLYTIQIFMYVYRYTDYIPVTIMSVIIFFTCFIYDTGTDLATHGAYNRLILLSFMMIWTVLIVFLVYFKYYILQRPLIVIGTITILILLCYLKYQHAIKNSCYGWENGFKNSKIENPNYSKCIILPPKICYYEIFNGFFDLSKILGDRCENMGTNKLSNIIKYLPDKTAKIIGYPRTEHWDIFPSSTYGTIQKRAMKEMVNMEDEKVDPNIKKRIEVTTNFYKNPPEVTIDLKKDLDLVKKRNDLFEKNKDKVTAKNVLYIFIDSLSRVNFKIKLPKFWNWIGQFYQENKLPPTDRKYETFQFLKYHGVGRYTSLNMVPAFFGVYNIYYGGKYFLTDYKKRGYITGQSLNFCGREVFDIDGGAIEEMKWDSYDHEMNSFFCDGNFTPYNEPNPIMMGTNSIRKRCMYNKNTTWYTLEYMRQFFEKYNNEAKFFRIGLVDGHEGTTEVIKYSDDLLVDFFEKFRNDGHLDNTMVFIHTDHGFSMPGPFSLLELEDYLHEVVLPSYFLIVPTSIKNYKEIRKNLLHNQNSLITPFTTYNSLLALLNDRSNVLFSMQDSFDIFTSKISYSRSCRDTFYDDDYFYKKEFLCRCQTNS